MFMTATVTTSGHCRLFVQVYFCFKIAYVLPQVPGQWLKLNCVTFLSGQFCDDDPGGGTARVQDRREGGSASLYVAVPPGDMSGDSVAQHGPEDEGLACLNVIPVKHPSPGARVQGETCSMDEPVSMLHSRGTSNEYANTA